MLAQVPPLVDPALLGPQGAVWPSTAAPAPGAVHQPPVARAADPPATAARLPGLTLGGVAADRPVPEEPEARDATGVGVSPAAASPSAAAADGPRAAATPPGTGRPRGAGKAAGSTGGKRTGTGESVGSEGSQGLGSSELTEEEQQEVAELKKRDREVRAHEQAHLSAAGPYARGGAQYDYETGPDGHRYATGGGVGIDTSPVPDDPSATIQKARVVKRAALAPAEPSPQDRRVAAEAGRMENKARRELSEERMEEMQGTAEAGAAEETSEGERGGSGGRAAAAVAEPPDVDVHASVAGPRTLDASGPAPGRILDLVA